MDPSNIPSLEEQPAECDAVTHLKWTLSIDWRSELPEPSAVGTTLQPGWRGRATAWRDGQEGTESWAESLDPSQTPSWRALQNAHAAAGLNPQFRSGPATSGGRHYGWYQDLERRMIRKFDVDGQNDVTPMARAVRGYLDITHTHPFEDGNTRAAINWIVWSLAGAGIDIADLGPLVQLSKQPADSAVITQVVALLS